MQRRDEPIWALGAMSGTSLDGVDAALLRTDGASISEFGEARYRAYTSEERQAIRTALGRWPGEPEVAPAAEAVLASHVEALSALAEKATLVGFHGQTLAHAPEVGRTHQAGDGAALARKLGRSVAWDMRSADVAAGGEGAPLAPAFHHACARWTGATAPVAVLNLGGVGNLTWADPRREMEEPGALLAFDTGPANAPIDDLCAALRRGPFDRDGVLARAGRANAAAVAEVLSDPYFDRPPPKSLDRDSFAHRREAVDRLRPEDAAATWVAVIAASVARSLVHTPLTPERLLVTGGGRRNPAIMASIAEACGCTVEPIEAAGLDGDMLEAQAFAFVAVRVLRGLPITFPGTTGVGSPLPGGRIDHPAGGPTVAAP
jgi:anhydro-N-acetylmuramic acid kinase